MPVSINVDAAELDRVRKELSQKKAQLEPDEAKFLQLLLDRAEAGRTATSPASTVAWTWTYRF